MNRIYFFSGTGNSLQVAKTIAEALPSCELVAICKDTPLEVPANPERLGFVFPNYANGVPRMVEAFIRSCKLPAQNGTYLFAAVTYGGVAGNALARIGGLLNGRAWRLQYGAAIRSYPNAVIFYPMLRGVRFFTRLGTKASARAAKDIAEKRGVAISASDEAAQKRHESFMAKLLDRESGFWANAGCASCGLCEAVCPAGNISLENGAPVFGYCCEGCVACIQHCPKQAIQYRDKTEKRRRYTHPQAGAHELLRYREGAR